MRAVSIAAFALAVLASGCGTYSGKPAVAVPSDPEYERLAQSAHRAYREGNAAVAIERYRSALNHARASDGSSTIAEAAYNLAAAQFTVGALDQALASLAEADVEAARRGERRSDTTLLRAQISLRHGHTEAAHSLLNGVVAGERTPPSQVALAHLLLAESMTGQAGRHEHVVAAKALAASDPVLQGRVALQEAALRREDGDWASAADACDRAAKAFQKAARFTQMTGALRAAAEDWAAAGEHAAAADRQYRAARSLAARGQADEARSLLAAAEGNADGLLRAAIVGLQKELDDVAE